MQWKTIGSLNTLDQKSACSTMVQNSPQSLHGITYSGSSSCNPQGNSIIERIHQSVGNVLQILVQAEDLKTVHEATQVIQKTLALTVKACRCATNGTLGHYTSGALAFKCDMLMNIPLVSDIIALQTKRQEVIDKRLLKANASRFLMILMLTKKF